MTIGRNPHVSRAQAAEQKAADAPDVIARTRALRDAAHQWDRAAEREKPGKVRLAYEANATRNRELADAPETAFADDVAPARALFVDPVDGVEDPGPVDPSTLN